MKLKNLFIFNAIVALGHGIAFVFAPEALGNIYGMDSTPSASLLGQFFGVELIAVGLLCWLIKDDTDSAIMSKIVLALLIADVVGIIVSLMGTLSSAVNALGWSAVIIYLILVIGYANFWLRRDA